MNCPLCRTTRLTNTEMPGELKTLECPACHGRWIKGYQYWRWLAHHGQNIPEQPSEAALDLPVDDSGPGKLCPECGHFIRRQAVGRGVEFSIDHCMNCGGFWLDGNEWEILASRGLHDDLHFVFSIPWQNRLKAEEQAADREHLLREKLGDADYERAAAFIRWLKDHPHKSIVRAMLADGHSGGA